jgi:hypothetical protein
MAKKAATKPKTAAKPKAAAQPDDGAPEAGAGPVGRTIKAIRPMTAAELKNEGWATDHHGVPAIIVLDNGDRIYASRDDEGNGPGVLFGMDTQGNGFRLL